MNKKQKILFLLHLPPPFHGSSIVGLNIKNDPVINESFDCSYINLLASNSVTETGKVNFKKIFGFIITFSKVFRYLLLERPRICYLALTTTGAALYKDFFLVVLLKLFSVKPLFHLHNKGVSIHKNSIVNRFVYNYLFKNSEVIILSKHLYSDIQAFVPISKVHICPNGVKDENINFKNNIFNNSSYSNSSIIKILFLSNLIESKGIFILMESLALLKQKSTLFKCVVIGSEGDITSSQFNECNAKLGLGDFVSYEGKKFGEAKNRAFLEADIFAFPTYYDNECFPLVLLEAMSYSLPIVSTFEGGIQDIVEDGETGFLTKQKDAYSLATSLELLINNPVLRKKMGRSGRKKYEKEFSHEIFTNRLLNILKCVFDND